MTNNNFGKYWLVEECQKVTVRDIRQKLKESMYQPEIAIMGQIIHYTESMTGNGGIRQWFECPICGKRSGILFVQPITSLLGCRRCLGLKYRKCVKKGMVESEIFY